MKESGTCRVLFRKDVQKKEGPLRVHHKQQPLLNQVLGTVSPGLPLSEVFPWAERKVKAGARRSQLYLSRAFTRSRKGVVRKGTAGSALNPGGLHRWVRGAKNYRVVMRGASRAGEEREEKKGRGRLGGGHFSLKAR